MKDWLIKALGGYTKEQVSLLITVHEWYERKLERDLEKYIRPRDKNGRFIKKVK